MRDLIALDARRLRNGSVMSAAGYLREFANEATLGKAVTITRCFCAFDPDLSYVQGGLDAGASASGATHGALTEPPWWHVRLRAC